MVGRIMHPMRMLSWNVQWFLGLDGTVDVERVIGHARTLCDFDVLCLQEVSDNYPDLPGCDGADQAAAVAHLLPGFTTHFAPAVDELAPDGLARRRFGNLIASRWPVAWTRQHALPYPHDDLSAAHPSMPRVALEALLLGPHGPIRVITTHLEYYVAAQRLAQAQGLVRLVAEGEAAARHPPAPDDAGGPFRARPQSVHTLLCGDFNCARGSDAYEALVAGGLVDAWRCVHADAVQPPTFRLHEPDEDKPPIACDFVFASVSLTDRLLWAETDSMTMLSDHQPVWVEVDL